MECAISYVVSPGHFYAQRGTAKEFDDFAKLVALIQDYCGARASHFHSVGNVEEGEIMFFKSSLRSGEYVRGQVVTAEQESCSTYLIDYGLTELGVISVLKIDPSVKRFATIEPFAKKFCLAFLKPNGGRWCDEATEIFKQHCQPTDKLIYLPTEDPDYITLVTRRREPPNGIIDVSVLLIQAGYAKRVSSVHEDDSAAPSIAASVSDITQQLHSVGIQTEPRSTASTSTSPVGVKPPPGFDVSTAPSAAGDYIQQPVGVKQEFQEKTIAKLKSNNAYVPPALRAGQKIDANKYQQFKLNHELVCDCIICSIRNVLEAAHMTNKERLEKVLATDWPKLKSKEEAILRCSITGTQLNSEERELLLDILLGVTKGEQPRRKSVDSSTQVTSSSNRFTLSSYAVEADAEANTACDDITIMNKSSDKRSHSESTTWNSAIANQHVTEASVHPPAATNEGSYEFDPSNWSDPDDDFLDSSDSEADFVLEGSTSTITSASTRDTVVENIQDMPPKAGTAAPSTVSLNTSVVAPIISHNPAVRVGRGSPLLSRNYPASPQQSAWNPGSSSHSSGPSSPDGKASSNYSKPSKQRFVPPARKTAKVASYGLGLSAANRSDSSKYKVHSLAPETTDADYDLGGFGVIQYCSFCGATDHRSANCPEGTKNLFIH